MDFLIEEAGGYRPADAGNDGDVEKLADAPFELDPFDDIARREMHDLHAAPGIGITAIQLIIQHEPRKRSIARQ